MAEEIKVVVREERQGNALAEEQQRIRQLQAAAEAYDKKGNTTAAQSARREIVERQKAITPQLTSAGQSEAAVAVAAEAKELQRALVLQARLGLEYGEAAKLARAQLTVEKGITEEKRTQGFFSQRVRQQLVTLGRDTAFGGSPATTLSSVGGQGLAGLGARIALPLAAIAAVLGGLRIAVGQQDKNAELKEKLRVESATSTRRLGIAGTWRGTSGEVQSERFQTEDEIFQREQARPELQRKAQSGILGRLDKWTGLNFYTKGRFGYKPQSARDIGENEAEIARLRGLAPRQEELQQNKFSAGEGGLDLQLARDRGQHSVSGIKAANEHQQELDWLREYNRLRKEGASDAQAAEAGNLKVKQDQWEIAQRAASGLVDARSGAGDIARAASIAVSQQPDQGVLTAAINALHETAKSGFQRQHEITSRKTFGGGE